MRKTLSVFLAAILIMACTPRNSLMQYSEGDVGISTLVEFGTIVSVRRIHIRGEQSGTGAAIGGLSGAATGSVIGSGQGNTAAIIGGAAVGIAAGMLTEKLIKDRDGIEYTVTKENGVTLTIAQNVVGDEPILNTGQRVMVQSSGSYQRVIPADQLPTQINRPKGIKVVD
jgi:outer membrane lipoprotein SlyB